MRLELDRHDLSVESLTKPISEITFEDLLPTVKEAVRAAGKATLYFDKGSQHLQSHHVIYSPLLCDAEVTHKPRAGCVFCLENGEVKILHENSEGYSVVALDFKKNPVEGCYLIIPKRHIEVVPLLPKSWQATVNELLAKIPEVAGKVPYNLTYNQGSDAGQRVPHVHAWVIVRQGEQCRSSYQLGLATILKNGRV